MLVQSFTQLSLLWFRGAVLEALQQWLRQQRQLKKLSKVSLANQLGKPTSYIVKVEQGSHILEVMEYLEYCHALNVEPSIGLALIEQELRKKIN